MAGIPEFGWATVCFLDDIHQGITLQVGVDHGRDDLLEVDRRRPAELDPRLGRITGQLDRVDRADEFGIDPHVPLPVVDAGPGERRGDELARPSGQRRWR